jgi:hypothetical protein
MPNLVNGNVSQIVLKKFVPGFKSTNVLCNAVDRQLIQGELNPNTGETVFLKRPHQYKAFRSATGDLTSTTTSNLISGKVAATVSNYCTVWVDYQQFEEALKLNQLDRILEPAYARMSTEIELELANYFVKNAALSLGTAGTAITKWSDVAQTGSMLTDIGAIGGRKYAIMDPWAAQNLADKQGALQSGNVELIRSAWEDAQIAGNFAGVRALMSNALANRTSGSAAGAASVTVKTTPTVTYDAVKDTMQMTVVLTGASLATKNVAVGDQVQFNASFWLNQQTKQVLFRNGAAVPFTGTVTAAASAVSNDITVVLSGAGIVDATNPQYNTISKAITAGDSVTILGAASTVYKPNIFFHESAVAMGTVVLPKLHGWDSSVFVDPDTGLSMRATMSSNPTTNVQAIRIDLLPAFAITNPMFAGVFYGNP